MLRQGFILGPRSSPYLSTMGIALDENITEAHLPLRGIRINDGLSFQL